MFGFLGFLLNINLYVDFDFFAHFFRLTSLDKQSPQGKGGVVASKNWTKYIVVKATRKWDPFD